MHLLLTSPIPTTKTILKTLPFDKINLHYRPYRYSTSFQHNHTFVYSFICTFLPHKKIVNRHKNQFALKIFEVG